MFNKIFKSTRQTGIMTIMDGTLIPLHQVKDELFSQKMMGDGFAIIPTTGNVYAPISGEITTVFPTGHAYGIVGANGVEVLIHLGIDTVTHEGHGFVKKVKVGDMVKQGDLLAIMDLQYFIDNEVDTTSIVIFTKGQEVKLNKENELVSAKTTGLVEIVK